MPGEDAERRPLLGLRQQDCCHHLRMPACDASKLNFKEHEAKCVAVGTQQVLLDCHLSSLRAKSGANYAIAILCLVYCGVNMTCLILNSLSYEKREEFGKDFHLLEFWSTFLFAVLEVCALAVSPQPMTSIYGNPLLLKAVMFANISASFVPAALITFSVETFETVSHEVEYCNEITMSFVDLVLLFSILKNKDRPGDMSVVSLFYNSNAIMVGLATFIAILQLAMYNGLGCIWGGSCEQVAHFFEFIFEIISAGITFWFAVDSKIMCDEKITEIYRNPMAEFSWRSKGPYLMSSVDSPL